MVPISLKFYVYVTVRLLLIETNIREITIIRHHFRAICWWLELVPSFLSISSAPPAGGPCSVCHVHAIFFPTLVLLEDYRWVAPSLMLPPSLGGTVLSAAAPASVLTVT